MFLQTLIYSAHRAGTAVYACQHACCHMLALLQLPTRLKGNWLAHPLLRSSAVRPVVRCVHDCTDVQINPHTLCTLPLRRAARDECALDTAFSQVEPEVT